jgi:hypothetical protein
VDQELDRFKQMNLAQHAGSRGYRLVRREPTRGGGSRGSTSSSLLMRHATTDDKIVVRLDRDGHWTYFSVRDDRDNGTIVDFLQRRGATTIAQVRAELRSWCGEPPGPAGGSGQALLCRRCARVGCCHRRLLRGRRRSDRARARNIPTVVAAGGRFPALAFGGPGASRRAWSVGDDALVEPEA